MAPQHPTTGSTLAHDPNGVASDKINGGEKKKNSRRETEKTPKWVVATILGLLIFTYVAMPVPLQPHHGEEPSIHHVFFYGWLTALSTGLGVLPLVFVPNLAPYWVGVSNGKTSCAFSWDPLTIYLPQTECSHFFQNLPRE
jgi:hypothetical protein